MPHMGEFTKERAIAELFCRIKTGEYTGDGSTSQAITGIGFRPKAVFITSNPLTDGEVTEVHFKTDQMEDNYDTMFKTTVYEKDNRVITLDSDGFTIDDDGQNLHPNMVNRAYTYLALG